MKKFYIKKISNIGKSGITKYLIRESDMIVDSLDVNLNKLKINLSSDSKLLFSSDSPFIFHSFENILEYLIYDDMYNNYLSTQTKHQKKIDNMFLTGMNKQLCFRLDDNDSLSFIKIAQYSRIWCFWL